MNSGIFLAFFIATTILNPSIPAEYTVKRNGPDPRFLINTKDNLLLNVPYVHQVEGLPEEKKQEIRASACGPTAINMILKQQGMDIDLYSVIEALPTSVYVRGQMFYNLYDGPKYFGKESVRISKSYTSIYNTLKDGNPIILNIQNYNGMIGHAVVVVGMKEYDGNHAKSLIVHDPYKGPYREFIYINEGTLKQPEGYSNYIGILDPFYIK